MSADMNEPSQLLYVMYLLCLFPNFFYELGQPNEIKSWISIYCTENHHRTYSLQWHKIIDSMNEIVHIFMANEILRRNIVINEIFNLKHFIGA
jgi:hypothetical protein